ncbi:DUF6541 family protein [Dactylosporangium sp. NPDC000555]|uniref:DUF6541 family protein n=1 Tax=Dactylosporangium sp. NPDC000555 TaxID=3154260 RepID=UPI00331E9FB2
MTVRGRLSSRAVDALVTLGYLLGAVYALHRLWADPNGRYLTFNFQDNFVFEWFLTHATHVFTQGESPFFSDDVNSPLGVNLMANTSILTLALPLTPITLWLGTGVTFAIITTLALAGTAAAWYWVLTRDFGRSRLAAGVASAFLGFAPGMMSQTIGHPNIAGQYLVPFIVAAVLRMRQPGKVWRHGLVLAALVVAQAGINEELLFFTALTLAVFILAYVPWRELPGHARVMLPKCGVTLLVAGAVLAYPLYFQFTGPQSYHGLDQGVRSINLDVLSFVTFSRNSIVGDVAEAARLNRDNASEENSFFGWPLVLLLVAGAIALRRNRLIRALAITGFVFVVGSLGSVLRFDAVDRTGYHGPWYWISKLPLFDSIVPARLGLIVTVVVGIGLAHMIDRLVVDRMRPGAAPTEPVNPGNSGNSIKAPEPEPDPVLALVGSGPSSDGPSSDRPLGDGRLLVVEASVATPRRLAAPAPAPMRQRPLAAAVWGLAILAAILPLFPKPHHVSDRPALPALFTDGNWRTKLPPNPVVAPLPGGWNDNILMMRWSIETNFEVKLTAGYFLGPNDTVPEDKSAHFGPGVRETVAYLNRIRGDLTSPNVTAEARADMRADLKFWKATNIVMVVGYRNENVIRETIDKLVAPEVAPGRAVDGVWVWDVRAISGAG